ncbi:acyltransferase family protein [Winogradskyella pacifica]|uniref:acyltransferase family protein n=1 Tax=Winogradskyella pacifica TaxID=664642 RepID=UPI0015CD1DE1|nr:acyltransferase family protein [Winogradskyella pacifica]
MKSINRFLDIDILKGILIIFVILGHSNFKYTHQIYWFHMPAFFLISGFLFNLKNASLGVFVFLKKKTIALMVPYIAFLFSFLIITFLFIDDSILNVEYFFKLIFGGKLLINQYGVFWFITSLLFTIYLFTFLYLKIKNKKVLFLSILICFFTAHLESFLINVKDYKIYMPLNIDTSLMAVVYFYIGFVLRIYYQAFNSKVKQFWYFSISIALIVLVFIFLGVESFNFDMKYQSYGNLFYSLLIPVSITLALLVLIIAVPSINFINSSLAFIGRQSLLIMYLHLLIKYILIEYNSYDLTLYLVSSIILPLIVSKVLEKNKHASFLFLGRSYKLNK